MSRSAPKRILMTADCVGGVWSYALELIHELGKSGVEVVLATMGACLDAKQRAELQHLDNVELRESSFKLEWMEDPWEDVKRAGDWLLHLEQEFEPDLVHLNNYAHGKLPWRAPSLIVGHSCVLSWWRAVKREPAPASKYRQYEQAVREGLEAAAMVVAPSIAMLTQLDALYGPLRKGIVIPNGRNTARFEPGQKENFILSAGRLWDEAKNVRAVCACSLDSGWTLKIAGETTPPAGSGGAGADIQGIDWLGKLSQTEIASYFARAAIYVSPAKYEPFGLSILEAALSGCALVLGDIPSLRENWTGVALFVSPDNPEAIESEVQRLTRDHRLRRELGRRARRRALNFDIQFTANAYLQAYSEVLGDSLKNKASCKVEERCVPA